jgi:hypothetical protein
VQLDELIRAVLHHPELVEQRGEVVSLKIHISGIELELSLKGQPQAQETTKEQP